MKDWKTTKQLTLVNLKNDLTPCENIAMVSYNQFITWIQILCELGKVPAISVPVVHREAQKEFDEMIRDTDESIDDLLDN